MREDRGSRDRVSRRSSTGFKRDTSERERRQRIRLFEDADDLYESDGYEQKDSADYDERRDRFNGGQRDEGYDRDRRRDEEYDRRGRNGRPDEEYDRRREAYERDEYRDRRREERRDGYEREEQGDRDRREDRYEREDHRRGDRREPPRKQAGGARRRKTGGDTDRFAHQIIPYVMFWVALFGAVSLVLRDIVGVDGSTGVFGSWFADFLCGLLGPIAYALPIFLIVIALRWKRFVKEDILAKKLLLSAAFLVLLSAIVHVFMESRITRGVIDVNGAVLYSAGVNMTGGGFFGGFVGEYIGYVLRAVGTGLLCIPLLLVIGIYLVGLTPSGLWQRISFKLKQMADRRRERVRARYSGEEERKLHNSRRSKSNIVKYEDKPKTRIKRTPSEEDDVQYEFRASEDEIEPARRRTAEPKEKTKKASAVEMVDIPDDEPEEISNVRTSTTSRRAGDISDSEQALRDILNQMNRESEPEQSDTVAKNEEERPLQGTYYSPFSLTHRSKIGREAVENHENRVVIDPADGAEPASEPIAEKEESLGETVSDGVTRSYYENGVLTERHSATTIYKKEPVRPSATFPASSASAAHVITQDPVSDAFTASAERIAAPESASEFAPANERTAPIDSTKRVEETASGMSFADDEPACGTESLSSSVSFERERLTDMPSAEQKRPAPAAPSFVQDDEEEGEIVTAPAVGVRTAFKLPSEEPAQSAASREPSATREPTAVPERPTRIAQKVSARTEPVKEASVPAPEPAPTPREHVFPPITLLNEDKSVKETNHDEENREKIEILRETLASFNVRIRDQIECARGPAITRYEFRPEVGVSVRQVINRQDDIALALAAEVRIEAPVPGKPAIGIEVPNAVRETVYMRTLLESEKFKQSKKLLEVPIGMGIGGNIVTCDLAAMPHLLVAGTTGSGKSVCINTILISLMYKATPKDLRLILIDPKQVEFAAYAHVPHLYLPIVTEMPRAVGALACAVQEMERRYSLMKDVGARNIEEYNDVTKNDPDREHLPYMVIVIDEFADLKMGCTTNDPENYTCRIAQKARAAGMHLIIGTQRPSVDVITGKLKNNIPSRMAFTVKQQVDSRTILDANGAESLCGRGDMLYLPVSDNKPSRVQGAFVSSGEVERVISYIRDHNDAVQYNQAFMEQIEIEMARAANAGKKGDDFDDLDSGEDGGEDPKFREAVELAIETQKVATSLLQRRLGVGYGRAAKIIDRMEALGYVSAPEGNKARKVLITYQEFAAKMGGDAEPEEDDFG